MLHQIYNSCSFEYDMRQFLKSIACAVNGFTRMFTERNFIIHIVAAVAALLLCIVLQVTTIEFCIVIICIALVAGFEMMNTAIEKLANLVHPGYSEKIKIIKDISAAAVLLAAITSIVIGIIIFLPKLMLLN